MRLPSLVPLILPAVLAACIAGQAGPLYDGRWWQSLSATEQDGFVSGYLDCYIWDAKGVDYSDEPIKQQIGRVSDSYKTNRGATSTTVPEVLRKLARSRNHEHLGERHGIYDGEFWRQLSPPGRVAFVQGYLVCERLYLSNRFSGAHETYVKTISTWYGVSNTDESQLNDKTANDKIGDVLTRLRDKAR